MMPKTFPSNASKLVDIVIKIVHGMKRVRKPYKEANPSDSDMASGGAGSVYYAGSHHYFRQHHTRRIVHISHYVQSNVEPTSFSENSVRDLDFQISFGRHGKIWWG